MDEKSHKNHIEITKITKNHYDFWNHKNLVHFFVTDMPLVWNYYSMMALSVVDFTAGSDQ